jgi:hypothetical protein
MKTVFLQPPRKTRATLGDFPESAYEHSNQIALLRDIGEKHREMTPIHTCVIKQIQKKITGYRRQDISKKLHNPDLFITFDDVIHLLNSSELMCFYCKNHVSVLYEIVRETQQWTLERIDNSCGHNTNNVEIACLGCNLGRRTMYHERYLFTKQFDKIVKKDS